MGVKPMIYILHASMMSNSKLL